MRRKRIDTRTREQRKADDSARIAFVASLLLALLALLAISKVEKAVSEKETEEPTAAKVIVTVIEESPVTECAYYDGPLVYYEITDDDRETIQCIVQGESGGESYEGKLWVATCLLNAMRKDGLTAAEVRTAYQYAGWSENISDETIKAVSAVFDDGDTTHDTVLWFYAPKLCNGSWHETQQYIATIGNHKFFAPKENAV